MYVQKWELERLQQEQIAALAHDLKTPVTIAMDIQSICWKKVLNFTRQNIPTEIVRISIMESECILPTVLQSSIR